MQATKAKEIRKQLGWSVAKLGKFMRTTENAIRKWECGLRAIRGPAIVLYEQLEKQAARRRKHAEA